MAAEYLTCRLNFKGLRDGYQAAHLQRAGLFVYDHWMTFASFKPHVVRLLVAVLVTTAIGSVIQTQINLAAVQAMGAPLPWALRLQTTAQDLIGFSPTLGGITAGAFLCALPAAAWVAPRVRGVPPLLVFAAAAAGGLALTFQVADAFAPMPTLIAATRSAVGTAWMLLGAVAGGLVFGLLHARHTRGAA